MGSFNKYFGLLLVLGASSICTSVSSANTPNTADELYSETVYIERASAEIPGALESNGRSDSPASIATDETAMESVQEAEAAVPTKKLSQRRAAKKSSNN